MIRLSEQIAALIRKNILNRKYKPGRRLRSEVDLAKKHGVSRSVIREALKGLESAGLVIIKKGPKGGIFVSENYHKPISESFSGLLEAGKITKDNLFDVWKLLGAHAALQAAFFADPEEMNGLAKLLDTSLESGNNSPSFPILREKFHLALARSSKNPVIDILMTALAPLLKKYFQDPGDVAYEKATLVSFRRIFNAIESRDPDSAKMLMEEHITRVREYIQRSGR